MAELLDPALEEFRAAVSGDDDDIDLAQAALIASRFAYPDLPVVPYLEIIDAMAERTLLRAGDDADLLRQIRALMEEVLHAQGLRGAEDNARENYYDPRNSFISDVLERRVGIPIALSIIIISVAARAGIPLGGTAMPMHFLVRVLGVKPPLLIDCYDGGHLLNEETCKKTLHIASQGRIPFRREMLNLVSNAQVLTRFLVNLKLIYLDEERLARAIAVLDRLLILNPEMADLARERGMIHWRMGQRELARRDLRRYLNESPDPRDAEEIRNLLRRME